MGIQVSQHSQPITVTPSDLKEGEFIEVVHNGVFYIMERSYGWLDLVIGRVSNPPNDNPEGCSVIRFNDAGLFPVQADLLWKQLCEAWETIQQV